MLPESFKQQIERASLVASLGLVVFSGVHAGGDFLEQGKDNAHVAEIGDRIPNPDEARTHQQKVEDAAVRDALTDLQKHDQNEADNEGLEGRLYAGSAVAATVLSGLIYRDLRKQNKKKRAAPAGEPKG